MREVSLVWSASELGTGYHGRSNYTSLSTRRFTSEIWALTTCMTIRLGGDRGWGCRAVRLRTGRFTSQVHPYRCTSLIRDNPPLGPNAHASGTNKTVNATNKTVNARIRQSIAVCLQVGGYAHASGREGASAGWHQLSRPRSLSLSHTHSHSHSHALCRFLTLSLTLFLSYSLSLSLSLSLARGGINSRGSL